MLVGSFVTGVRRFASHGILATSVHTENSVAHAMHPPEAMPLQGWSPSRSRSVLVADDDEDMRALVADTLRRDGHAVLETGDGEELLVALEEAIDDPSRRPDVVVSDVKMPRLSGLGVLAALRRARLYFPVVLMTVLADESIESVARSLGAVGVLRKPFDVDDLRTAVMNAVLAYAKWQKARPA